ncbi:MAG TPA: sialate O-acetylesterase [Phnomibacter sp.]|nr:sialate O-acetylesterase [Phnomibacter sp.]
MLLKLSIAPIAAILVALLLCSWPALAIIRLPPIVSSGMVLQQKTKATLWGWADPSERFIIQASWKAIPDTVVALNSGHWKAAIATPAAGGPFTIVIKGRRNEITLDSVLVGEVWICSGQSNMEMSNTAQIKEVLPTCANSQIRFFTVAKATSPHPQEYAGGNWVPCTAESLQRFSAIGYFFANKLFQELHNAPIGIIQSAYSGTPVELWEPAEVLTADPAMAEAATKIKEVTYRPNKPGLIYNAMIYPIAHYTLAGVLWYQGEGNTARAAVYQKMFTAMIEVWRKQFAQNLPFYYVQIAPYAYENEYEGALLMEQQTQCQNHPNTGMVVITDLVDNIKDQHPKNKYDVAIRLANLALANTYARPMQEASYRSPLYRNMQIEKGKIKLYFDYAPNGFLLKAHETATEFFIAGPNRQFMPAQLQLGKGFITVYNNEVTNPVAVRYGFSNTATATLFNNEGLPVTPFRTDNWEIIPTKK